MGSTDNDLVQLLGELEKLDEPQDEYEIRTKIVNCINENPYSEEKYVPIAEKIAFSLTECGEPSQWGIKYGPFVTFQNEDGETIEAPGLDSITSEVLEYWRKRAEVSEHPLFKFRYSDLAWEFGSIAKAEKRDVKFARLAIDAAIELASKRAHKHDIEIIRKLERALSLSLSINDSTRIDLVRDAILEFERIAAVDNLPGTWTSSFDSLIGHKRIHLDDEQETSVIRTLEERLGRFLLQSQENESALSPAEHACERLVHYYRSKCDHENAKRILLTYKEIVVSSCDHLPALAELHWLKELNDLLVENGMRSESDELSKLIRSAGVRTDADLHEISASVTIPNEEIRKFLDAFCVGSFEDALFRMAGSFIPTKERIQNQLKDLFEKSPLSYLISQSILDNQGRPIAQVGSLQEDPIGHYVNSITQNIQFEAPFLRWTFEKVIEHYEVTAQDLADHLEESPVFELAKQELLLSGIEAFIEKDHIASVSILIPVIEAAFRELLRLNGSNVYKSNKFGGINLKACGDCIYDASILSTFGEDIRDYLAAVLVDQRGWNIRNNVAHGIFDDDNFGDILADRVFHVVLVLGLVRKNVSDPETNSS